jgi:rSAM-associated Gly-rich repeat protein
VKTKSILKSLSALLSLAGGGLFATAQSAQAAQLPDAATLEARIQAVNESIARQAPADAPDQVMPSDGKPEEMRWGNWRNGAWGPGRWGNWRNGGWNNWRNGWGNRPWGNWFNR